MQHEIIIPTLLLDQKGNIAEPGFARSMLYQYRRRDIRAPRALIKEWDYYYVGNDRFGLALTIADNGYMGLDSVSFLNFDETWETTKSPMRLFPLGRTGLPESSETGDTSIRGKGYAIAFRKCPEARKLTFYMDNFRGGKSIRGDLWLTDEPRDSMVIATPFGKRGRFYCNQKINCMRAAGAVTIGEKAYRFDPQDSFGVLDWGRGVWTYHNTWYWASLSAQIGGIPFGFNLGYGFGDTSAASENMLFYGGIGHKLSRVKFDIPMKNGREDYLLPWKFYSDDDRLELDFVPILDRAACTDFKLLKSDQHQVFGRFSGRAVLDDGTVLELKNLTGFAEKVENKW